MSEERRQMMRAYGAEIIDVPPSDFKAAIELRGEICKSNINAWSPMQFENSRNIDCHRLVTGPEIYAQVSQLGDWAGFVSGAGTGGTLSGVGMFIEENNLSTKKILMIPSEDSKSHGIQGVNDGEDFLLDKSLVDVQLRISTEDAIQRSKKLSREKYSRGCI